MSVYVDNMNAGYGRMKMCHMLADTIEELHQMADRIGVQRKWFQNRASFPHYDICLSKKQKAIEAGAVAVTMRELAYKMRELRKTPEYNPESLRRIYHG